MTRSYSLIIFQEIFAIYNDGSTTCASSSSPEKPFNCTGVARVTGRDNKVHFNIKALDPVLIQGLDTITFNKPSGCAKHIYTIYAGLTSRDKTFSQTSTWVSLTNGSMTKRIHMESNAYGGEQYWLAGCLLRGLDSYQLHPINVFFSTRPDNEVNKKSLKSYIYFVRPRCQTCALRRLDLTKVSLVCHFK